MAFADKDFDTRFKSMGDAAERAFLYLADLNGLKVVRTGFDRPPIEHFETVPKRLRAVPDFMLEVGRKHYYIECKGTGAVCKFKDETFEEIPFWNAILPVYYFVYNSVARGYCILNQDDLLGICEAHGTRKQFANDRKWHYEVPRSALPFTNSKEFTL